MRHHHAWLDANGMPAYLEASSPRSRDLYAKHGYLAGEPFRVPDGTPFWPMWREPVAAGGLSRSVDATSTSCCRTVTLT